MKPKQVRDGCFERSDRKGWYISYLDAQGRRRKEKVHAHTLQQARDALTRKKDEVERIKVLGFTPPKSDSFDSLANQYLKYQRSRGEISEAHFKRVEGIVEVHLRSAFRGPVASIRKSNIQGYLAKRKKEKASGSTILKECNVLAHMLRFAAEREIIMASPMRKLKREEKPKASPGRVRYLQAAELKRLLLACPSWLRPIVQLALATGMRRSEILGLRVQDVDLAQGVIWLPMTKNGDHRGVRLNATAKAALEPVINDRAASELVFDEVTSPNNVTVAFARAVNRIGIQDFRFHDLRHTAASWLAMSGSDIHSVATLLGHKDLRMASRYRHLSPEFLAQQVNRLDDVYDLVERPRSVPAKNESVEATAVNL
jgi:integrase